MHQWLLERISYEWGILQNPSENLRIHSDSVLCWGMVADVIMKIPFEGFNRIVINYEGEAWAPTRAKEIDVYLAVSFKGTTLSHVHRVAHHHLLNQDLQPSTLSY